MHEPSSAGELVVGCTDLDAAIAFYEGLGFRLDMIKPADAPRIAVMSGHGIALRLVDGAPADAPIGGPPQFSIQRGDSAWVRGRAGMQYRDLIPGRLGGRFIASHIRIPEGGPVADYVHYHNIRFQMIYCRRGWVRVVYEDHGPPFVMREGDCVLQPPMIRHQVLEASPGLEVIEVAGPAEHETFRDHTLTLPTVEVKPQRRFGDQLFVRHIAVDAVWQRKDGFEARDTGIAHATRGLADVRVLRSISSAKRIHRGELLFLFVLTGRLEVQSKALGTNMLNSDDACVIPAGADYRLRGEATEVLEVVVP